MIFMSCVPTRIEIPVSVIIKRQTHLNSFSFDKNFILQHSLHMIFKYGEVLDLSILDLQI